MVFRGHARPRPLRALAAGTLVTVAALLLSSCGTSERAPEPAPAEEASTQTSPGSPVPDAEPTEAEREAATQELTAAVAADDVDRARAAIDAGAHLNVRGDQGRTPLVAATKGQQVEMALLLLDAGADPNIQDDMQDSAFLYAGAEGFDEILRATLEHGADVTSTNRFDGTALIPASEHGYVSTAQILIEAGVPLDHVNNLGWTALHETIVLGNGSTQHLQVVEALLAAGADPRLPDGNGVTPRDLAAGRGLWSFVDVIEQYL